MASTHITVSARLPRDGTRSLLTIALLGVTALAAAGCARAADPSIGGGESAALYSLSVAQTAEAAAAEARLAAQAQAQMAEVTLTLSIATADLVEALASGDAGRIDDASSAVRTAKQAAQRIATRLGADTAGAATGPAPAAATDTGPPAPGAGIAVRMARVNWDTGYMQAAIFQSLLTELGYTVSDPVEVELTPADFYPALARGEYDFWAHGWFPTHDSLIFGEDLTMDLPDGGVVDHYVRRVGTSMASGGLQGFLVDAGTADAFGIRSMADVAANPAPWDHDGDGRAEIAGCDEGSGCHEIIELTIVANGWQDSIEQVSGDYSDLWDEQIARLERGEPVLAYTWTPSAYIVELVPGRNAYWLSVPRPILGQHGEAALPANQCPAQPCTMGFTAADIAVVGNNTFLDANPAAERLFELVTFDVLDIALQNLRYQGGENTEADIATHAAAWIADNRPAVDTWLAEARAAATG